MKEKTNDGVLEGILINVGYAFILPLITIAELLGVRLLRPLLWIGSFTAASLTVYLISSLLKTA